MNGMFQMKQVAWLIEILGVIRKAPQDIMCKDKHASPVPETNTITGSSSTISEHGSPVAVSQNSTPTSYGWPTIMVPLHTWLQLTSTKRKLLLICNSDHLTMTTTVGFAVCLKISVLKTWRITSTVVYQQHIHVCLDYVGVKRVICA